MTRIARIETFLVAPRWLFVRIETDSGVVGWGEATCEGRARDGPHRRRAAQPSCSSARTRCGSRTTGRCMTKGSFYRGGPILASAVAGLDQALWDIAGKRYGAPVHQLLGGPVRDRIRVYGWVGGDEPAEVADQIREQVEAGLTAVKMNASGRMSPLATVAETRRGRAAGRRRPRGPRRPPGRRRRLPRPVHAWPTPAGSRRCWSRTGPFFVEEPVLPENSHLLGDFVRSTTTPVATGERLYSRQEFLPVLQAGIAVAQPDLSHAGGITEVRRIAALAEIYDVQLAPHCPLGPIALAACLQVGFATPNFLIQEQSIGIHYNQGAEVLDYLVDTDAAARSSTGTSSA